MTKPTAGQPVSGPSAWRGEDLAIVTTLAPAKGGIMRFILSFLISFILSTQAGAQTAEEAAAAAANAAFNVIEKSLISDFFKSTGLKPKELKVLGEAASLITGEEALKEIADIIAGEDEDENVKGKKKKKKNKGGDLPPGLAKRDTLPPGLARHLEKYGTLPRGLELRGLPDSLEARLPDLGPGRKRVVVDDDVLLIEKATGKVLDILIDVIGGN